MKQQYSVRSQTEKAFASYVSETKSQIESELTKLVAGLSHLNLHPQIKYAVLTRGKRLRPLLTILSAESVGGNRNRVMPLALAFELMHTATLVHDDIIDQDEIRRGQPALHKKWSVNNAILTGDALIALSVDLAAKFGETILTNVAQSALQLCDGEQIDITLSLKKATEEAYFNKIKEKSASLFKAAAYCGALAGGGSLSQAHSLAAFGENFGIAYQLRDDLLDLTLKENSFSKDLKSGRVTLPLIHLYMSSNAQKREQLETAFRIAMEKNSSVDPTTTEKIMRALTEKGSGEYCEQKISYYLRQAIASIAPLRNTEYKICLTEMAKSLKLKA